MTLNELVALVKQMRDAQRRYFRKRDNLEEAMAAERVVDAAIERLLAGPRLFEEDDNG